VVLMVYTLTLRKHLILFHMSNFYIVSNHIVLVTRCYSGSKTFFSIVPTALVLAIFLSDFIHLISGVVQGSGLGPLLFVLYEGLRSERAPAVSSIADSGVAAVSSS